MRSMNDCWRCATKDPDSYKYCEESVIAGIYHARLCTPCKNDWVAYVQGDVHKDLLDRDRLNGVRILIAREAKDEAALLELTKEQEGIQREFKALAEAWAPKPVIEKKAKV